MKMQNKILKTTVVMAVAAAVCSSTGTVTAQDIVSKEMATETIKHIDEAAVSSPTPDYIQSDAQLKSIDIHWDKYLDLV